MNFLGNFKADAKIMAGYIVFRPRTSRKPVCLSCKLNLFEEKYFNCW
jgi:hypothetical protein